MVNPAAYAFALLIATLLIETGRAFVLRRIGRLASSDAMLADATDRVADVLATIGVLAGLVGVRMDLCGPTRSRHCWSPASSFAPRGRSRGAPATS